MAQEPSQRPDGGPEEGGSPFASRWFIASSAFVAGIVLLAVIVIAVGPGESESEAKPGADPNTSAPAQPTADTGDGDNCPALADTGTQVPKSAPAGVTWDLVEGYAVPASQQAGPARIEGEMARCYAHTPTGALLASVQITARGTTAKNWRPIIDQQTVGDGKANYIKQRESIEAEEGTDAESAENGQIAAFKFVTYTESVAVIEQVWRSKNGMLASGPITLVWSDGDWKHELSLSPAPANKIDDLAGYIAWAGV